MRDAMKPDMAGRGGAGRGRRMVLGAVAGLAVALAAGIAPAAQDAQAAAAKGPELVIDVAGQTKGQIVIRLLPKVAPKTVAQVEALARAGAYDNVVFHRVIAGFMAQTGDVQYGKKGGDLSRAGQGGSSRPDLPAEFSKLPFKRGTVGMARTSDPNSGNSQFFITFAPASYLDGQYTVFGQVVSGMDVVDRIRKGDPSQNGLVVNPDWMAKVTVRN